MIVQNSDNSSTFLFKAGPKRKTKFLFYLSDISAFGNPAKKPLKFRGNYRKCMKILLENELNEFTVITKNGEYFEIGAPIFSRGRDRKYIEEYCKMYKKGEVKPEPARLDVQITIPPQNAIKVFSIKDGFELYIVNDGEKIFSTLDFRLVEKITDTWF